MFLSHLYEAVYSPKKCTKKWTECNTETGGSQWMVESMRRQKLKVLDLNNFELFVYIATQLY